VFNGGAAVANLVHRIGMPTGVVEILPSNKELVDPYAAWFCREFDLSYRAVVGGAVSSSGNFTVDIAAVVRAVDEVRRLTDCRDPVAGRSRRPSP